MMTSIIKVYVQHDTFTLVGTIRMFINKAHQHNMVALCNDNYANSNPFLWG